MFNLLMPVLQQSWRPRSKFLTWTRAAALAAAAAISAGAMPAWAEGEKTAQIRILYLRNLPYILSAGRLAGSIESWVKKLGPRGKLVAVESYGASVSGRVFDFESEAHNTAGQPTALIPIAYALETGRAVLFAPDHDSSASLLRELEELSNDRSDGDDYMPDAELVEGSIDELPGADGRIRPLLSLGELGDSWSKTHAIRYRILLDGKERSLIVIAKPIGEIARIVPALRKRIGGSPVPLIKAAVGGFGIWAKFFGGTRRILSPFVDLEFDVNGLDADDVSYGWEELKRLAAERESGKKIPLFVCSNLKPIDASRPLPCAPFAVVRAAGLTIGFLSTLDPGDSTTLRELGIPAEIVDPVRALRAQVQLLWEREKTDFIVLLGDRNSRRGETPLPRVNGIDFLIGPFLTSDVGNRRASVEYEDWGRDRGEFAYQGRAPFNGFSELTLTARPDTSRGAELLRVEESGFRIGTDSPADPQYADVTDSIVREIESGSHAALPDARVLWGKASPEKIKYHAFEIHRLSARLLRERTGAEAALVRVLPLPSDNLGPISEGMLAGWLDTGGPAMLTTLTGKQLRAASARLRAPSIPISGYNEPNYGEAVWLASEGLTPTGRIDGRPLDSDEIYKIALNRAALEALRTLDPSVPPNDSTIAAPPLRTIVFDSLRKLNGLSDIDRLERLRDLWSDRRSPHWMWRLKLDQLSLQFANSQVDNNTAFSQVREARIQSVDQILAQGSGRLSSELRRGAFAWDAGMGAQYGRATIKPLGIAPIKNETVDRWVADSELRWAAWRGIRAGGLSAGPFYRLAYDSEFTKPLGLELRRLLRSTAGLKVFDGSPLEVLYVAGVSESDYSRAAANTEFGLASGLRLGWDVPSTRAHLSLSADFVRFGDSVLDTPDDLKSELESEARLSVPVWRDLRVSQYARFYRFEGKVVRQTGRHLEFGFSLDFSFLFKPVY